MDPRANTGAAPRGGVAPSRHRRRPARLATEVSNYLGLLTIALALGWLVVAFRRRASISETQRVATADLVAVFVAGLLFALPRPVSVFGHDVWMPSRLLWEPLPVFRVISR